MFRIFHVTILCDILDILCNILNILCDILNILCDILDIYQVVSIASSSVRP